ncbi:uncharacterized protein LOC126616837 [Malus sylvestris]|uniref:uncharacterized protein LOC126616837 n=1 Tax=Malus sylvestris TaxID=3752 RepID=UPI0021AD037B|nr:uncharacterized protein LOC126616837 [Malus sylvestris]
MAIADALFQDHHRPCLQLSHLSPLSPSLYLNLHSPSLSLCSRRRGTEIIVDAMSSGNSSSFPMNDFSGRGFVTTRIVDNSCYVSANTLRFGCPGEHSGSECVMIANV